MFPATLTTERLLLRPLEPSDAPVLFERCSGDPRVTRYMCWQTNQLAEETLAFINEATAPANVGKPPWGYIWGLCVAGDPHPSGTIGVLPRATRAELGYALAHDEWGKGLMTEAVNAMCSALWEDANLWRVQAYTHVDNTGSARVLEKCGFRCEGIARRMYVLPQLGKGPRDHRVYSLVRDDVA